MTTRALAGTWESPPMPMLFHWLGKDAGPVAREHQERRLLRREDDEELPDG
jgi:hypothetical protein